MQERTSEQQAAVAAGIKEARRTGLRLPLSLSHLTLAGSRGIIRCTTIMTIMTHPSLSLSLSYRHRYPAIALSPFARRLKIPCLPSSSSYSWQQKSNKIERRRERRCSKRDGRMAREKESRSKTGSETRKRAPAAATPAAAAAADAPAFKGRRHRRRREISRERNRRERCVSCDRRAYQGSFSLSFSLSLSLSLSCSRSPS